MKVCQLVGLVVYGGVAYKHHMSKACVECLYDCMLETKANLDRDVPHAIEVILGQLLRNAPSESQRKVLMQEINRVTNIGSPFFGLTRLGEH